MSSVNIRVTKEFSFEMAHALQNYDGPCRNIHGHTYLLSVTILGPLLSTPGSPKDGMIMDFSDLKTIVQQHIINKYDHCLLLNSSTSLQLITELKNNFEKVQLSNAQPTCENILMEIVHCLRSCFPAHIRLVKVSLRETTSSFAEWLEADNLVLTPTLQK